MAKRTATRLESDQRKLAGRVTRLANEQRRFTAEQRKSNAEYRSLARNSGRLAVLHDQLREKIQMLAEGLVSLQERMDRGFTDFRERFTRLEGLMLSFIRSQGELNRELKASLRSHEARLAALEERGVSGEAERRRP